mmetsp:Transcript_7408/g.15151  ORF Transcript_7408/g.15151 Transcript_7408/m.15151 type:complete len:535 (-) Transcript_7408:51-1655(-)
MSSDNNEQPPRVQLGFSLPLHKCDDGVDDAPDTSSFDGQEHNNILGHTSPNWCDWDGGKIGGLPSWLNPRDLPDGPLCCRGPCSKNIEKKDGGTPLRFIAQLYCPADDVTNNPAAFHRSVYVFACPECCSDSSKLFQHREVDDGNAKEIPAALLSECVRVLRCQLPKKNDFYPINGDGEEDDQWEKHTSTFWSKANKDDQLNLCAVCGQKSKGKCPKQGKWFCGPHHQKECLRASKQYQKTNPNETMPQTYLPSVCYESELVVEEEPDHVPSAVDNISGNSNDTDTMNSKSLFQSNDITDADVNLEQSDLNELTGNKSLAEAATGVTDPTTLAFYARMNIGGEENDVRDQCLRYSRWSSAQKQATDKDEGKEEEEEEEGALWLSSDNRPDESFPPKCQHCGAERAFEFQILPQMIHYLLNDPDSSGDNNDDAENGRHVLTESERAVLLEAKAKIESGMELPEGFQEQHDLAVASARDALLGISRKGGDKSGTSEEEGAKDGLDWGTIAVYTCTASCGDSGKYLEEAAWVQPPLD